MGVEAAVGESPILTGEFAEETQRVLELTKNHPPRNRHQKGPILLWVMGKVTESQQSAEHYSFLDPSTTYSVAMQQHGLSCLENT